jgi:hypothetical protein
MWVRPLLPLRKHQLMAQRVGDVAAEQFPERWTASSTLEEATGAVGVLDEALGGAPVFSRCRVGRLQGGRQSHRSLRAVE